MRAIIIAIILSAGLWPAFSHESWISKEGHRNANGEWCCGEGDCFVVPKQMMGMDRDGYVIRFAGDPKIVNEHVPWAEVKPSKDGEFWRCKRPDGSRRCFFAPPPSM